MWTPEVIAVRAVVERTCWLVEIDEVRTKVEGGEHLVVASTAGVTQVASGVELTKRLLRGGGKRSKGLLLVVLTFDHLVWLPISPPFLNERRMG